VTTEFAMTEFVTTEFVTTGFVTTIAAGCGRPGAQLPEKAIGRSDGDASLRDVTTNAMICENYV
jgi:hypothetical protein